MGVNVFAVPSMSIDVLEIFRKHTDPCIVFFICFRECLECSIIVSVLLSFLKQTLGPEHDPVVYKKLRAQIWWGIGLGLLVCLIIGGAFIGAFYGLGELI